MSAKFTPGPWRRCSETDTMVRGYDSLVNVADCGVSYNLDDPEKQANARLIAASPDHALFASAIAAGCIRWEMFEGRKDSGEICVNGLRWATQLDEFGVPILTQNTRDAILKAKGEP